MRQGVSGREKGFLESITVKQEAEWRAAPPHLAHAQIRLPRDAVSGRQPASCGRLGDCRACRDLSHLSLEERSRQGALQAPIGDFSPSCAGAIRTVLDCNWKRRLQCSPSRDFFIKLTSIFVPRLQVENFDVEEGKKEGAEGESKEAEVDKLD